MESIPKVGVILPVYHEPLSFIQRAAESINAQTYENYFVLFVLDDPTNNEALTFLRSYCATHSGFSLKVNPHNMGLPKSLNSAIDQIDCDLICRMDADDISHRTRLEKQVAFLEESDCDLVGSYMNTIDESGALLYTVVGLPTSPDQISKALAYNNCVMHPTWLGKVSLFKNKYREMPYSEDYDFLLRAVSNGARLGNCPEILLDYTLSSGSISRSNLFRQFLYQKVLTGNYRISRPLSVEEARCIVDSQWSPEKERRFTNAYQCLNAFMGSHDIGSKFQIIPSLISSLLKSPAYVRKLYRLAMTKIIGSRSAAIVPAKNRDYTE